MPIDSRPDDILLARLADDPKYTADLEFVAKATAAKPPGRVALDFSNVTYLNSSNLARLLRLRKSLIEEDGRLTLFGMNGQVASVFRSTALDRVFVIARDEDGALGLLGA
jgi:anti-anti-sigma factor